MEINMIHSQYLEKQFRKRKWIPITRDNIDDLTGWNTN